MRTHAGEVPETAETATDAARLRAGPLSGKISSLAVQARDPERVNVHLEGRFAFGLSNKVVVDAGLRLGDFLSADQVGALLQREESQQALQQSLNYLSYRPRSEHELRRYLGQKGHAPETIDSALQKLRDYHYLDDEAFALTWVENRQRFRPRGPRLLRAELLQKGIEREVADQAVEDGVQDERGVARDAAEKKAAGLKAADYLEFSRKLGGFLSRRGFGPEVVWGVVRELWAEQHGDVPPLE